MALACLSACGRGLLAAGIEEFPCLPDDPAAALREAVAVADEEALCAAPAEHLEPVPAGFRPRMRRGPRALWGMATDRTAEGLWHLGRLPGEEARARRSWSCCCRGPLPRTSAAQPPRADRATGRDAADA
ncbi:hypothetical protein J7E86_30460 [Streptomyces sp. ISL-11]|nr:hypothetical protein [Streptomyces sp. ISL-11]